MTLACVSDSGNYYHVSYNYHYLFVCLGVSDVEIS